MKTIFDPNYIDFLKLLKKNDVKYVLVGGLAVVMHGHFRATKDMDIFYEGTKENSECLLQTINEFGFGYLKMSVEDLLDKSSYIKLGTSPVRIDLFCDLPGVSFNEVYDQAIVFKDDDLEVKVIHVNHLIQNKKFVGRLQDLDDIKKLQKILKRKK
ncbi:MAG TPA: nucleotidyltransferase [Chitinophagaceae bacterium]